MRETSEDDENIPLFELKKRLRNQNRSTDSSESDQEMEINAISSRRTKRKIRGKAESSNKKVASLLRAAANLL